MKLEYALRNKQLQILRLVLAQTPRQNSLRMTTLSSIEFSVQDIY